jgi:hypothetical protein
LAVYDFKNLAQSTSASPLTNVATTFTLVSTAAMSTVGQAVLRIDDTGVAGSTKVELVLFLGVNNNTGTNTISSLTRGVGGTSAQAFGAGYTVSQVVDQTTLVAAFSRLDVANLTVSNPTPSPGRYASWTTVGAPTGVTAVIGDHGLDGNSNLWSCTVAGTPGTWKPFGIHQIDEQTPAGATTVRVPASGSLPTGYRNLRVQWKLRDTNAVAAVATSIRMNGDAGTNYVYNYLQAAGTTVTGQGQVAQTSMLVGADPGSTAPGNQYGFGSFFIYDYNGADGKDVTFSNFNQNSAVLGGLQSVYGGGGWLSTAAITFFTFLASTAFTGVITTYGE